jgi:hypothetical protein
MAIFLRCRKPEEHYMKLVLHTSMLLALTLLVCTCRKREPPSAIVQKVEAAGAGDLSSASSDSIEQWFLKHQDVAWETKKACIPIRDRATAEWNETTEARVCEAAIAANVFNNQPQKSDQYSPPVP